MSLNRCDECSESFSRPTTLRRHVQTVHRENRLTCEECPKTFSRKDLLERHMKSHRGGGKLSCSICSRSFRSDYLAEHRYLCARKTSSRCAQICATLGTRIDAGVLAATKHSDTRDNSISTPATARADELRVVPSVYSYESLPTRLLVEQAKTTIASRDIAQFNGFLQKLEKAGTTIQALQTSMLRAPYEPHDPFIVVAAQNSASAIIRGLVKCGLDVNVQDKENMTALDHAEDEGTIRALIDAGAVFGGDESRWLNEEPIADNDKEVADDEARSKEVSTASPDTTNGHQLRNATQPTLEDFNTALRTITSYLGGPVSDLGGHSRERLVQLLQALKTAPGEACILRALCFAMSRREEPMSSVESFEITMRCLMRCGWDIHQKVDGLSLLHRAVRRGKIQAVKWLLDHGAGINELTDERPRRSPLAIAVDGPLFDAATVSLLLSRGAWPNGNSNPDEQSPLAAAAIAGVGCARLLLAAGANVYHTGEAYDIPQVYHPG